VGEFAMSPGASSEFQTAVAGPPAESKPVELFA
jgi:hypothetical protein